MSKNEAAKKVATAASGQGKYYISPKGEFSSYSISPISHNYGSHPLMVMNRLQQLAEFLMERKQCRFVSPDIKQNSEFFHQSETVDGRSLDEVFEHIEEPTSWIALYNIEAHPEYKAFLEEVISSVKPLIEQEQKKIFNVGGFIFISAPPSVTPFHIDRENNFWLQIRGRKLMTVFDHRDSQVISQDKVERFIVYRGLDDVRLKDEFTDRGHEFDVGPGDGVYFPSTSPHMTHTNNEWVKPTDGVSVSIGVVFYTDYTRRHAQIHQCNNVLRRFGLSPSPPGSGYWSDLIKSRVGHHIAKFKANYRGYNPPPGSY